MCSAKRLILLYIGRKQLFQRRCPERQPKQRDLGRNTRKNVVRRPCVAVDLRVLDHAKSPFDVFFQRFLIRLADTTQRDTINELDALR